MADPPADNSSNISDILASIRKVIAEEQAEKRQEAGDDSPEAEDIQHTPAIADRDSTPRTDIRLEPSAVVEPLLRTDTSDAERVKPAADEDDLRYFRPREAPPEPVRVREEAGAPDPEWRAPPEPAAAAPGGDRAEAHFTPPSHGSEIPLILTTSHRLQASRRDSTEAPLKLTREMRVASGNPVQEPEPQVDRTAPRDSAPQAAPIDGFVADAPPPPVADNVFRRHDMDPEEKAEIERIVRDVIFRELQGSLGDQIAKNIRRIAREEIDKGPSQS